MQAASSWLYIYPQGFRDLLLYVKENYGNPTVYITENGDFCCHIAFFTISIMLRLFSSWKTTLETFSFILGVDEVNNKSLPLQEALKDSTRIEYYHKHLLALQSAIRSVRALAYACKAKTISVNLLVCRHTSLWRRENLLHLICDSSLQRRGECERLLRVVAAGQFRVGEWLHGPVRDILRGLQWWTEAVPQELRPLVQGVPQEISIRAWTRGRRAAARVLTTYR